MVFTWCCTQTSMAVSKDIKDIHIFRREISVFKNYRHITIENKKIFLSTLHDYKIFTWHSVPVAHNYAIRLKRRRRIRTFKQQTEQFLQYRQSVTERTVPWNFHHFIHGTPRGSSIANPPLKFSPRSNVLWRVKRRPGTVNCTVDNAISLCI